MSGDRDHCLGVLCTNSDKGFGSCAMFAASTNGRRDARIRFNAEVNSGRWTLVELVENVGDEEYELEVWARTGKRGAFTVGEVFKMGPVDLSKVGLRRLIDPAGAERNRRCAWPWVLV